mmetsp:Transcript_23084/g.36269  ORF Transcript_23084/g.36269 Transcript_23084/m.36269 type:complete len:139 (+) Transcript_23084:898-1314(+)
MAAAWLESGGQTRKKCGYMETSESSVDVAAYDTYGTENICETELIALQEEEELGPRIAATNRLITPSIVSFIARLSSVLAVCVDSEKRWYVTLIPTATSEPHNWYEEVSDGSKLLNSVMPGLQPGKKSQKAALAASSR